MKKYSWDFNEENDFWTGETFNTIQECIEDAKKYIKTNNEDENEEKIEDDRIFIGENTPYVPSVWAGNLIEMVEEHANEEIDFDFDWDIKIPNDEELKKFNNELDVILHKYLKKWGCYPELWSIKNIKEYSLEG